MKEHPILFSTPMVQAILEGRKTQTRRMIKCKKKIENPKFGFTAFTPKGSVSVRGKHENGDYGESFIKCPFGKVGDILWVRETFNWDWKDYSERKEKFYFYKATTNDDFLASGEKWKPSIFMPKAACRIRLENIGITVQRLQDITVKDAIAEGIQNILQGDPYGFKNYLQLGYGAAVFSYKTLWQSINGPKSWQANPWVWVIEFKKINQ